MSGIAVSCGVALAVVEASSCSSDSPLSLGTLIGCRFSPKNPGGGMGAGGGGGGKKGGKEKKKKVCAKRKKLCLRISIHRLGHLDFIKRGGKE